MSDHPRNFTAAQWREIEAASRSIPGSPGRYIALAEIRNILARSRRTLDQNALLHVLFDETISKGGETLGGWTRDDIKEWALGEYWGWEERKAFGRTRLKPRRRSSSLSKTEMVDFIEWYVAQMATHGIVLELPGDAPKPTNCADCGTEIPAGYAHICDHSRDIARVCPT
jgi:hypothetical protein